jgi:hypothetical protein
MRAVLLALALALLPQARATAQPLPADLALVPPDATGFVHVRFADLWANDVMKGFRDTWAKAGPDALAALDKQFVPAPSTISRGTVFVTLDDKGPAVVGVLAFSKAFDTAAVVKSLFPKVVEEKVGGKTVFRAADGPVEIAFPDDKHILIGFDGSLNRYLARPAAKDGPLAPALKLAAEGKKVIVASADISSLPIPRDALAGLPAELQPILKAKRVTLALDLGADARLDLTAGYADAASASDAEKAAKALADLGRKELAKMKKQLEAELNNPKAKAPRPLNDLPQALASVFALGSINRLDETLADPKLVTRTGSDLAAAVPVPKDLLASTGSTIALSAAALLPAVQKVREAAARMSSANNLKQLGLAIHNYESVHGHLPRDIVDKNGKPILSWRVAILPYIEQDNVYKLFKQDEPWDSDNNKQAASVIIKTFLSPDATATSDANGFGLTNYRGISGPGAAFDPTAKKALKIADFTDGLSNTIMVLETAELVPWAKPGDFPFDPKKDLPKINPVGNRDVFQVLFGDGSVRAISTKVDPKTLKALFTRNGGEVLNDK